MKKLLDKISDKLPRQVKKGLTLLVFMFGLQLSLVLPGFTGWLIGFLLWFPGLIMYEAQIKKEVLEDLGL